MVLSSLYTIAFVAALRRVPFFPAAAGRCLGADLAMQLLIADLVAGDPNLPRDVAGALLAPLDGNTNKVLISLGLWLPYLILSTRVNITYRSRVPAWPTRVAYPTPSDG